MTLADYQQGAARTMNPALTGTERLVDATAGLAEEAGEVLAHVRKHAFQGHALDRERLATELGDALWCLAATATAAGLSLGDVAAHNLDKLRRRYPDGFSEEASRAHRKE
jgi:NTP pyrophosphatase (non-canonical NTP hydrolase)